MLRRGPSLTPLFEIAATAVLWIGLFWLNQWLFSTFAWTEAVSWIFLPAAVRLLAVLLWDWRGMAGIAAGTWFTNLAVFGVWNLQSMCVAIVSAAAPYVALSVMRRRLHISRDLSGVTASQLVLLAGAAAATSAVMHQSLFAALGVSSGGVLSVLAMFVGDSLGTAVALYALKVAITLLQRR